MNASERAADIVSFLLGVTSIVTGIVGRDFVWALGSMRISKNEDSYRPMPKWAGTTLFVCIGIALICYALATSFPAKRKGGTLPCEPFVPPRANILFP